MFKNIFRKNKSLADELKVEAKKPILKTPDLPVPFGYNTAWLAVKCDAANDVINALHLKLIAECNWVSGINAVYNNKKIFVSPCLDGFILVIGIDLELDINMLLDIGKRFGEIQYYVTNHVVDFHMWVKIVNGAVVRNYSYVGESGEVLTDEGAMTREEEQLGFAAYINSKNQDGDWDGLEFPDEESVLNIAAAWGVDPKFEQNRYDKSTGYLCALSEPK